MEMNGGRVQCFQKQRFEEVNWNGDMRVFSDMVSRRQTIVSLACIFVPTQIFEVENHVISSLTATVIAILRVCSCEASPEGFLFFLYVAHL